MIDLMKGPLIMGVVNVTPDSFSDGGNFLEPSAAIKHGLKLIEEGADILDIGGESTRPGAEAVTIEEEQARILPVIEELKKAQEKMGSKAPISVDTRHADTMQKAIDVGADIINDISALTHDERSIDVVKKARVPVILMHMKGTPESMQKNPEYGDVLTEVLDYLAARIQACLASGIDQKRIVIDPGIGFGKTLQNNLTLLKNLDKFHDLGCPVILGASRKSFIEKICSDTPENERLAGSISAALAGVQQGVQIFRVHDVKETRQAFAVHQAIFSD